MRHGAVGVALAAFLVVHAVPASAQGIFTDARRIGMGGLSLQRDGNLRRYNPAYRAVPRREGQAKITIPIPLGILQFFKDHPLSHIGDDPLFNPDSARFNPVELANLVLNPPLFYEVKKAPTPTNDVQFTVGKNQLIVDLGKTGEIVPSDRFGIGGSSRLLDPGLAIKGVRLSVMGWLHDEVGFQLDDTLLAFLQQAQPARDNTTYSLTGDGIAEAGFAPSLGFAGRIAGDTAQGLYVGVTGHYYLGVAYGKVNGTGGFLTGDTLFAGTNIVTPVLKAREQYSKAGNSFGHGVGADVGLVYVSGPIELGVGVNDIGATLTWPDTRIDTAYYISSPKPTVVTQLVTNHVETKTKLPIAYVANVAYHVGSTTVGADVLDNGRGTTVHVGGEQRVGPLALRGGVARDQRKKLQFGWGGGLRFGPFSLDVGFWTHSNSLSNERGVTMAMSLSIY